MIRHPCFLLRDHRILEFIGRDFAKSRFCESDKKVYTRLSELMTRTKYILLKSRVSFRTVLLFMCFFLAASPIGRVRSDRTTIGGVPGTGNAAVGARPVLAALSSLKFVENDGQTAESVRFISHGSGYELLLMQQDAVLALSPARRLDLSPTRRNAFFRLRGALSAEHRIRRTYRVHLVNSNPEHEDRGRRLSSRFLAQTISSVTIQRNGERMCLRSLG